MHSRKFPEERSNFICWSVMLIDSVLKEEKCYLQIFLKESKYIPKEKNMITDDLKFSSGDLDESDESKLKSSIMVWVFFLRKEIFIRKNFV